jgi:outer membrane murein-binding lipoprotein Lpp
MTAPSPAEQFASDIRGLQAKIASLQDGTRLNRVRSAVEDLQTTVNNLDQRVAKMRAGGYAFEKELEGQAADLAKQWAALYAQLSGQISQQSNALAASLPPIEARMAELAGLLPGPAASSSLGSLQTSIVTLEEGVAAAERQISAMYDGFGGQVSTLTAHLDQVEWMLAQLAEAKFTLLPTEAGIAAVKAVWCKEVKQRDDDPSGILYLTDQRLIFEEKEEIVTKKVLFVATEKQKVQELKWDVPVALIDEIKPSKQGMLKNEDHLDLSFGSGAPFQTAHVHIWQDGNTWLQLLNRAKTKDFDSTRAIMIDQAAVEKVKSVPSQCPSCGGNISQVVLRGQDEVKCQYCGFVIRL